MYKEHRPSLGSVFPYHGLLTTPPAVLFSILTAPPSALHTFLIASAAEECHLPTAPTATCCSLFKAPSAVQLSLFNCNEVSPAKEKGQLNVAVHACICHV